MLTWFWALWCLAIIFGFMDGDRSQWTWSGLALFASVILGPWLACLSANYLLVRQARVLPWRKLQEPNE